jgi:hypothetical protein
MNEIQLIRGQLAAERRHASAVASACAAAADGEFAQACVEYLVRVLAWFEERDQRAIDLARRRRGEGLAGRALEDALARPGTSREALEKLERAMAAGARAAASDPSPLWQEFTRYFEGAWSARREAIDARLAEELGSAQWRTVAGIDADSILEERRSFARVRAALPAGVALAAQAAMPLPR